MAVHEHTARSLAFLTCLPGFEKKGAAASNVWNSSEEHRLRLFESSPSIQIEEVFVNASGLGVFDLVGPRAGPEPPPATGPTSGGIREVVPSGSRPPRQWTNLTSSVHDTGPLGDGFPIAVTWLSHSLQIVPGFLFQRKKFWEINLSTHCEGNKPLKCLCACFSALLSHNWQKVYIF